jgi:uncharacterized protein
MTKVWVELADIPAEGREFSFADQGFWQESMDAFGLKARIARPLSAEVRVLPQDNGALVTGRISGALTLPCSRCSEEFEQALDGEFEVFEETGDEDGMAEEARVVSADGTLRLDLGAVLWEQLVLALPENPVCQEDCRGLCPKCGGNRNFRECDCSESGDDPRLAVFRNLKIS